jgi:hypothetical protein
VTILVIARKRREKNTENIIKNIKNTKNIRKAPNASKPLTKKKMTYLYLRLNKN